MYPVQSKTGIKEGGSLSKEPGVRKMFDAIAGRYDLMNRVMTMGQDQKWRHFVVAKAGDPQGGLCLDLATGTGDIGALMMKTYSGARVVGADFSWNMLQEAKKRFGNSGIRWQACDANRLPFADNTFRSVTFGYLLRNVDNAELVLREVHRVLMPGGRVVCLDTTPPEKNFLYPFIRCYLKYGIPVLGKMIARDEAAYAYLTGSTMGFYTAKELESIFIAAGFSRVSSKKFMFGTIGVHWGEKPAYS
ncbi:bifunctional demethylmenaquinone methyltransferase/2-methoxy-6-polyprenyl-1,4-benzoquinol methylase UbiE [Desulforhopalus singaporensis]|uniref:Demethylmenaquinone methyltransferase n=1 Tax=Desulforhopalus singaporensis TaxID=91360 RepID=A0A1H0V655_9BACT|nr:bifunctional demethylmenaquinone methyltransferase/2-methoxy-6-polyprenyl-1,4-benzoquinol methylase UbiE [Desulforhopalus singaporensis]SDP73813.1 demethylmenaquinone methyltransferase / 2-methoxy-6-polyprenyl-1,4-benzoquinol methylase [Desulforhopalus singaporensis]